MADQEQSAAATGRAARRRGKQAVVVIHGVGEQVPMETLRSFVHATWVTDEGAIPRDRPDPNTGGPRTENPVWSKPDARNRSYELRRITTEASAAGRRTDFYELYWAHLMHGTTWEHVKVWLVDLLWRAPRRVPPDVFGAWIALWIVTAIVAGIALGSLLPLGDLRQCLAGACDDDACAASDLCWTWVSPLLGALVSLGLGGLVNVFLLKYVGDVARYVKATPVNVARRQEIREKGVELLETLMGCRGFDHDKHPEGAPLPDWDTEYERIVVVAHSLGAIIAYDVLRHSFARVNRYVDGAPKGRQLQRDALERLLREAAASGGPLDLEAFRRLQKACREELNAQGSPWIVSDIVTLGSPLTHAEFLLADNADDLRAQQAQRILPTCPPTLEWDQKTKRHHFTYWPDERRSQDDDEECGFLRYPHHAAHFAYTRWTNLHSPSRAVLWGDILSGPAAGHFDLQTDGASLQGILDVAVLPERRPDGRPKGRLPFFSHIKYWDPDVQTGDGDARGVPFHIRKLREAIDLLDR